MGHDYSRRGNHPQVQAVEGRFPPWGTFNRLQANERPVPRSARSGWWGGSRNLAPGETPGGAGSSQLVTAGPQRLVGFANGSPQVKIKDAVRIVDNVPTKGFEANLVKEGCS